MRQKLLVADSLRLDFSDKTLSTSSGILDNMVYDFGARFESGEIESIEEYYQLLDDKSQTKLRFMAGTHRERFERQLTHSENFLSFKEVNADLRTQLSDYIEQKNLAENDLEKVKERVENSGHS